MKMFRKFVALALAAVLSLGVLSGCGSTAASSSRLQKYLKSNQIYMEVLTEYNTTTKMALDGEIVAWIANGHLWVKKGDNYYDRSSTGWGLGKITTTQPLWKMTEDILELAPKKEMLASLRFEAEYPVKDQGSFYAEIYETEGETLAYCFQSEELKLIVHTKGDTTKTYPATMSTAIPSYLQEGMDQFKNFLKK